MLTAILALAAAVTLVLTVVFLIVIAISDADFCVTSYARFGKQPDALAGKVVWITGASSGIGEHIAYCLLDAGCRLVLSSNNKDELDRVKQECLKRGKGRGRNVEGDILVLPLDLLESETHRPAVQKVINHFNKIDILVNNAGRSQRALWQDVELDVDRAMFEVNVLGHVSLTQEVLPHMVQRKQGHVVVTSSLAGKMGVGMSRSYTGAKHAIQGYFEALRTEMSEHNINVTILCPGPVFSNVYMDAMTGKQGEVLGQPMKKTDKRLPTDRLAYLACVAIANRAYEAWISQNPFLILTYIFQYFPDLGRWILKTYGMQVNKMREGR